MGQKIAHTLLNTEDFQLCGAFTHPRSDAIGEPYKNYVSGFPKKLVLESSENIMSRLDSLAPDIIIDFSTVEATSLLLPQIIQKQIPVVVGTTGLSRIFLEEMTHLVSKHPTNLVIAPNMAIGMNLFMIMVKEIYKKIPEWEAEIIEYHHHHKRDSPSGTAIALLEQLAEVLQKNPENIAQYGRSKGVNPRNLNSPEIGIHSIRAGDIVGEHSVIFAGEGERIEFTHRAHTRDCFAVGALTAARFLLQCPTTGDVFSMKDIILQRG